MVPPKVHCTSEFPKKRGVHNFFSYLYQMFAFYPFFRPLNAGSLPGGSFSSAEPENDRNGHLELHPQPKSGEVHFATVTTALNPSLFYVSIK